MKRRNVIETKPRLILFLYSAAANEQMPYTLCLEAAFLMSPTGLLQRVPWALGGERGSDEHGPVHLLRTCSGFGGFGKLAPGGHGPSRR
jgi:hypothetical protein